MPNIAECANETDVKLHEKENLLNNMSTNKENSIQDKASEPKKNRDRKKFTFNQKNSKTKSNLTFEIDFHGLNFSNLLKRNHFRN